MVANFDPKKRQPMAVIDINNPPSLVDILSQMKLSLARQALIDQLDAMSRQMPDLLGDGYRVRLEPAPFAAAAVWALDWALCDRHRSYSANFVGMQTFTVSFNGRRLLVVEKSVTA